MNKRIALVMAVGTVFCLPTASSSALAVPTAITTPSPTTILDTDKRLDRLVSVSGTGVSLSEIASELSDKTLTLNAESSCADQKIQIRVRNQPLRSVMAGLEHLLPGTWEASEKPGQGYDLAMSRESQAYRARWWDTFLAGRDRGIAFQREQILESMQNTTEVPAPDGVENKATKEERRSRRFFNLLPASVQTQVAGHMDEGPFYQNSQIISIGNTEMELQTPLPVSNLPGEARDLVQQSLAKSGDRLAQPPAFDNVVLVLADSGFGVFASLLAPDGRTLGCVFETPPGQSFQLSGLSLDQSWLPPVVAQNVSTVPPDWLILADYQRKRFWPNDAPKPSKEPVVMNFPPTRTVDWLARVGDKANLDYISDYYSLPQRVMTAQEMAAPLTRPLKEELDTEAASRDLSWEKAQGDIYLFRNNRWYRNDELEVPNSVLKQIKAPPPQPSAAPVSFTAIEARANTPEDLKRQLDVEASIVTRLTRWQIANGLSLYVREPTDDPAQTVPANAVPTAATRKGLPRPTATHPFAGLGHRIPLEYNTLKFYGSLNDDERSQLVSDSLPVSVLAPDQQALAVALAPQLSVLGPTSPTPLLGIHHEHADFVRGSVYTVEEVPDPLTPLRLFVVPQPVDGTAAAAP